MASLLILGVMVLGSFSPAFAQSASSREQAIAIAQQQNGGGGRVLAVREDTKADGKRYYTVKIITNGRVRVIRISGQ